MGKHLPSAAKTRDDFIHDEERPHLLGNVFDAREKLGRWHDIPRRPLNRLDDDGGNAAGGGFFDALAHKVQTEHAAIRIAHVEGAAITIGIRYQVGPPGQGSPALLRLIANQAHNPSGFAMEAAPETHHLEFLGGRFRQADGRLNRLRPAAVQLRLGEFTGREGGNQFEELGAVFRRKTADDDFADLGFQRRHQFWMRMPEARDRDTSVEIDIAVAVNVRQGRAFAVGHSHACELGNTLDARREELLLSGKEGHRLWARHSGYTSNCVLLLGHTPSFEDHTLRGYSAICNHRQKESRLRRRGYIRKLYAPVQPRRACYYHGYDTQHVSIVATVSVLYTISLPNLQKKFTHCAGPVLPLQRL